MPKLICILLLTLFGLSVQSAEMTPEQYVEIFSSPDTLKKKKTSESLAWAGLTDPKIFDLLEQEILASYTSARRKDDVDYLAWLSKGLGFSGNQKYRETLEKVSTNSKSSKLKKYGQSSLGLLKQYQGWNKIIVSGNNSESYPNKKTRFNNMLTSGDYELIRIAAKRIHTEHFYEKNVLDTAIEVIESNISVTGYRLFTDSMAWLCKAVAGSRDRQYFDRIKNISREAKDSRLRNYAKKYLRIYFN